MNENTTTYREKGRALFLTAIMVLSVVAMAASFGAAPAAAISDTTGDGVTATTNTTGVQADHSFNVTIDGGEDVAGDSLNFVNVSYGPFSGTGTDTLETVIANDDATVLVNGSSITVNDVAQGSTGDNDSAAINVTQTPVAAGDTIEVQLSGVDNPNDVQSADISVDLQNSDTGTVADNIATLTLETTAPNVEVSPERGIADSGETDDYTVTLTDSNGDPIENGGVEVANSGTDNLTDDTSGASNLTSIITTDANGEATISLTNTTGTGAGTYDATFTEQLSTGGNQTTATHEVAADNRAFVDGNIGDDSLRPIENDQDVTINVSTSVDGEIISNVRLGDLDTLASSNPYVASAGFESSSDKPSDQRGEYFIEFKASSQKTYTFEADLAGFDAFDGDVQVGPSDQGDRNIRLTRLVDADRLTILDDGERSNVVDDIDSGNVPVDDPQRLGSTTVDIDETVTLDIFTETDDDEDFGTALGELAPFDNQTSEVLNGSVTVVESPSGVTVGPGDLDYDPATPLDTDENGLSSVDASYSGPEVQGPVTFRVAFNASSNTSAANDVAEITFQPNVGDTGTISGEIAKISEDIQLGTQDNHRTPNTQPAENVPVWAVQADRVIDSPAGGSTSDNTVVIEENGTVAVDDTAPDRLLPEADNLTPNEINLTEGESYRVVTYQGGEANVLDVRSEYLVTTPDEIEVIQNETSLGFDVHAQDGATRAISLHFLEDDDYQVQKLVTWENTTNNTDVGQSWQNISVSSNPGSLHQSTPGAGSYKEPNDLYSAGENLTLAGVDARYDDEDRIEPIDYTNENGDFELLNLPTTQDTGEFAPEAVGKDYVVIAGAGDIVAADGTDQAVGFANFRGFDKVTVYPNAQEEDSDDDQYNVDLSVQDYDVDITYSYDLEVVARQDDGSWDDTARIETGTSTDVGVLVQATNLEDGSTVPVDSDVLQGQNISLSQLRKTSVGDLASTSLVVDDTITLNGTEYALATTTFNADTVEAGFTNVSASTTNDNGDTYETVTGSGFGDNDQGDQAEIEVFKTIEVTGDVVNENDDNVKGARVLLYETDVVDDPANLSEGDENVTASTVTGVEGSYVFTGLETGKNYSIKAVALDDDENQVTNTRQLNDGEPVQTALGGEDIVVIGASPDQPLEPPEFTVSNLSPADGTVDQGDDLTVTADVENTGAIEGTQDITLSITNASGTEVFSTTQSLTLDTGASDSVSFTISNVQLDAGDYTHTVESDDDEVSGSLTVNETESGSDIPSWAEPYVDDNGVATLTGASQAITDYNNGDLGLIRASNIIESYNTQTPIQDIVS